MKRIKQVQKVLCTARVRKNRRFVQQMAELHAPIRGTEPALVPRHTVEFGRAVRRPGSAPTN
jgi:hypothetical protein